MSISLNSHVASFDAQQQAGLSASLASNTDEKVIGKISSHIAELLNEFPFSTNAQSTLFTAGTEGSLFKPQPGFAGLTKLTAL